MGMKIKKTSWMWYVTLDEAAETMPIGGVDGGLHADLWNALVEDPRYTGDRHPEEPSEKFESPNIIARAFEEGRIGVSHIVALNKANKEENE